MRSAVWTVISLLIMPTRCIVGGCSNTTKDDVSLHRFPKDSSVRKLWTSKIKLTRARWAGPTDTSVVCSAHFEDADFEEGLWAKFSLKKQRRLKATAIPQIRSRSVIDDDGEPKRKHRTAAEKRKKIRMLEEMLGQGDPPGGGADTPHPADDAEDNDMPGPSSMSQATETLHDEAPIQGEGAMAPVQIPPHCPATRTFGTQTRITKLKVPTRVKGIQKTVKTSDKGVQVFERPLVTSREATCTCKLPDKAKEGRSSSSSSSSSSPSNSSPESPGYTPDTDDDSESSDQESSPTKAKKKRRGCKPRQLYVPNLPSIPHQDPKYIVFETQLMELLKKCTCSSGNVNLSKKVSGTHLKVWRECFTCGATYEWDSQPYYGRTPAGNMLLSASTLFAGGSATKTLRILDFLGVARISERTFFRHQRNILQPAIEKVWRTHQDTILARLRESGSPLVIGGDGRADSPGHSAKYGAYTGIELTINKIVDIQIVQSNEVKNSSHMELEGYKRLQLKLTNEGLTVGKLVTDRHRQLAKHVRETSPNIKHVYDVWHLAKGVRKKVHALSKKKGCEVMGEWEQSINNHMYWVASSTPEDEPELRVAKWTSLANHIQGLHEGHSEAFPRCLHGDLEPDRKKKWLKPGTMVCEKFESIITSTTLLKDVKKMSSAEQTSYVESFHALMNHFAPKLKAYKYHGMVCRLHLAALHFNTNIDRPQATTRGGKKCYKVKKPKYKPGKATVSPLKGPQDFGYVAELTSEVARRSRNYKEMQERKNSPPSLSSRFNYPSKDKLIKRHKSRFNIPNE